MGLRALPTSQALAPHSHWPATTARLGAEPAGRFRNAVWSQDRKSALEYGCKTIKQKKIKGVFREMQDVNIIVKNCTRYKTATDLFHI
ncbi:hypothetical protein UY3_02160 [Chelonia mydas]|uniref:Uncharacterized protein n=1 Tax=Chelonia mydas TaxID=8469 RepID=M7BXJ9_CHEMY|nr:hypothetical protein UY3_02160 [Chelonia mydas]